jgi:hypothetical protein
MDLKNFGKLKDTLKDNKEGLTLLDTMEIEAKADEGKLSKSVEAEGKLRTYKQEVNKIQGLAEDTSRADSLEKLGKQKSEYESTIATLESGVSDKDKEVMKAQQDAQSALDKISAIEGNLQKEQGKVKSASQEKLMREALDALGIKDSGNQGLAVDAHLSANMETTDFTEFATGFVEKYPSLKETSHKPGARSRQSGEQETTSGLKDIKVTDTKSRTEAIEARMAENTN